MTRLVFDYDPILYECGFIGEERHVKVVHRESGDTHDFPNRTAFYGHHKKKAGGWLAEWNAGKSEEKKRGAEEFDYFDVQVPQPISRSINTMKSIIQGLKEVCGANSYYGYSGKGDSFRLGLSTVVKYKGNRDNALRPVHLDELKQYLIKHHACKLVQNIEADDACSIDVYTAYRKWMKTKSDDDKLILAYVDKDYLQVDGHIYNTNKQDGIDTHHGFGYLNIVERTTASGKPVKEVKGRGRMWLYQQVLDGDSADNYFANSATTMKWGEMSAYNLLSTAKNDKEAFEALVKGYKTLYPAPKKITGWRGDEIEIDWLYMLQENFTMAFMLRKLGDKIDVKATLEKLGINCKEEGQ
jgi:hypothetical protein